MQTGKILKLIQGLIQKKKVFFYDHALIEAKKDGVTPEDVIHTINFGEIIEEYPERKRVLILGWIENNIPLHVVCDYSSENVIIIPTVYIPDSSQWIRFRKRRR